MALIVSREQLHRILSDDGHMALWPAHTEKGSTRYAHACVGQPFARLHVGDKEPVFLSNISDLVFTGPHIKKIDALQNTKFSPTYIYPNEELMTFGKLDRFYMSLLKAIHRPVIISPLKKEQQFMVPSDVDGTDPMIDQIFYDYLKIDQAIYVETLCGEQGFNTDKLHAYMKAHNHNAGSLWVYLKNKWVE
jgi:hypothetical protein|uniref:Uncharacterized protein n=1 Tax=Myoviridae sp. ctshb19 TaxID=2825194 RepID=A0A8S5UH22_9CAUD|nr:MAG TPA: hypothetical protein [Myoviridae sp. ctshb19]